MEAGVWQRTPVFQMFKKGARVKCLALSHFGKKGMVISCVGKRCKILFDTDRVEGRVDAGQNLALAHWFLDIEIATDYNLEFNADRYAIATPTFWEAWHANGKKVGMYAPARVPASVIGLPGNRLVWIVFVNGDVRQGFLDELCITGKMGWEQR